MKRLFAFCVMLVGVVPCMGATPITSYVQLNPPNGKQPGTSNIQNSIVTQQCFDDGTCQTTAGGGGGGGGSTNGTVNAAPRYSAGYYFLSGTTTTIAGLAPGTSGYVLNTGGSSAPPFWSPPSVAASGVTAGSLASNVIASSLSVNSIVPSNVSLATYPNILIPTANIANGTLGSSVIASSLSATSGSIGAGTNITITGTWPNPTINAGSGNASSLGVNLNGVSVTSPTAQINFTGSAVSASANGSTATISINGSSVYPATATASFPYGLTASTITVSQNMGIGTVPAIGQQLKVVNGNGGIGLNSTVTGGGGSNNAAYLWATGATQNDAMFIANGDISLNGVTGSVGQCLISQGNNNIPTFGSCGSGGGSSSALGVNYYGVPITSPTVQINFQGPGVFVSAVGSTATVTISSYTTGTTLPFPSGATNYIQNTGTLQAGSTFYVSSGTVQGYFNVGTSLSVNPNSGVSAQNNGVTAAPALTATNNSSSLGELIGAQGNAGPDGQQVGVDGTASTFFAGPHLYNYGVRGSCGLISQDCEGGHFSAIANGSTNYALWASASGTSATNYGLYIAAGQAEINSSMTVTGSGGVGITYGAIAGSMTITNAGGSAGTWIATEGTDPTGTSGAVTVYAATGGPALKAIIGSGSTNYVMLSTGSTAGHIAEFGSAVGTLIDGGVPGAGGSPGGSNTQIQFNNSGSFGGASSFTYNNATGNLTSVGNLNIQNGSSINFNTVPSNSSGSTITNPFGSNGMGLLLTASNGIQLNGNTVVLGSATFVYGVQASTLSLINSSTTNTLTISTAIAGINQVAISSALAVLPTDFQLTISSQNGTPTTLFQYDGHIVSSGTTPVVTSCGSGPSIVGTDTAGTVTIGSGGITFCNVNFANAWGNTPVCTASDSSTSTVMDISSLSTSSITFGFNSSLSSVTIYYICVGEKG